ncbi:synaptopodin-2-like isoform X1 [Varroa destructor]|uniref:PDZ domain-containing protein n=1 Tax=Varroa destructor TaxID=109461 RepID=A0A7M7M8V9_VARDE|nr:synaptopodin-2-like isoform X1 [Varroa destructor]
MTGLTVQLCGGPPWGFRLHGGRGQNLPLTVAKVRRKSKSFGHLLEGDKISRIGGRSVDGLSHDEAMALVDSHQDKLDIEIIRRRDSISGSAGDSCEVPSVSLSTKTSAMPIVANPDETGSTHTPVGGKDLTGAQVLESELGSSVGSKCDSMQPTSQITGNSSQTLDASHLTSPGESTRFADRPHLIDANTGHENETRTHASETQNRETTTNSSTTVNISGAKFDLGSGFTVPASIGSGSKFPAGSSLANPFAGVEQILESESKSSKEQIPGGELNRLETRETKITGDGAYVQSHTLAEHKQVSSASSTSPLCISVKAGTGPLNDDTLLISPTGRPIKERYYKPLPDEQLKEIDDIMAPILNKKKVFTSSSFYEDANSTYPTVEEQVGMARKIAESLSSDSNAQSKGANMFFRRVKRSHKWVHQAPGISESEYTETEDCSTVPDPDKFPGVKISKEPPKLKLLMAPSVSKWEESTAAQDITVSPEVCLDIVKGLNSPSGKGSQMFAKRKKKSEDWVVDVDKLKAQLGDRWPEKDRPEDDASVEPPPPLRPPIQAPRIKEISSPADRYLNQIGQQATQSRLRLVKSPWEAAMESPTGAVDSAFQTVHELGSEVPWDNQSVRIPLAPLSFPSGPEVSIASFDTLPARSPRGWGQGASTATQNVCVTVNKKKPPPPPPKPSKIRPAQCKATATAASVSPITIGSPCVAPLQSQPGDVQLDIEVGPPAQFFNSYNEFIQAPPASHSYYPLRSSSASSSVPSYAPASTPFTVHDRQNFNTAPRGFGFGVSKNPSNFRSVHL